VRFVVDEAADGARVAEQRRERGDDSGMEADLHRRIRRIAVSSFLLFSACVLTFAYASAPTTSFALPQEILRPSLRGTEIVRSILGRLQRNRISMPIPVDDAVNSLDREIIKRFDCPAGATVDSVDVRVRTRHVGWNRRLAVEHSMGTYYWNVEVVTRGRHETIRAYNWLMIDPRSTGVREAAFGTGEVTNEALLYHELLHGQLLMSAMDTSKWQQNACSGRVRLGRERIHHSIINPAVSGYVRDRSARLGGSSLHEVLRIVGVSR